MKLPDRLREIAAEWRHRHLEGQLGHPTPLLDAADHIDRLEVALLDALDETEDLGMCPYLRRGLPGADTQGICGFGCTEEPECQTCRPREGWLSERHPVIAELFEDEGP